MRKAITTLVDKVARSGGLAAGLVASAIFLSIITEVFTRYFFQLSIRWISDWSEMGLLVIVYLSLALVESERKHIRIELLTDRLNSKARAVADGLGLVLSAVFGALITWRGVIDVMDSYRGGTTTMVGEILKWPFLVFIVIGGLLYTASVLINLSRMGRPVAKAPEEILWGE